MNPTQVAYLHMETGVILLFLIMVARFQLMRAAAPDYDAHGALAPIQWLPLCFIFMALGFMGVFRGTDPLLGLEIAVGICLSLLHPVNALCFMAHLMLLRPWELNIMDPLLTILPRLTIVLCVVSYLIHPKQRGKFDRRNIRSVMYLLGFSGWLLLTTIKVPGRAAVILDYFNTYFKSLTVWGIAIVFIESECSVREFELTLVLSSLLLMANGLYQFAAGEMVEGRLVFGRPYNLLGDPNDLGAIIVMALPFALAAWFKKRANPFGRLGGLLYAGFAAIVIWFTRSRGTMLGLAVQFLVYRRARAKRLRLSLILMACFVGVAYYGAMKLVPRDEEEMSTSSDSRITLWGSGLNMALHSPFLGVGYHQFNDNYMSYAIGTIYEYGSRTAHSSWFLALGESGFVGLFLYCAYFKSVFRIAWSHREERPEQLYSLAGYVACITFLSHTYTLDNYMLTGLIVASNGVREKLKNGS